MDRGFTVAGYSFDIEFTVLQDKALFNLQIQALDLPAIAKVALTVLTISLAIGISKA